MIDWFLNNHYCELKKLHNLYTAEQRIIELELKHVVENEQNGTC